MHTKIEEFAEQPRALGQGDGFNFATEKEQGGERLQTQYHRRKTILVALGTKFQSRFSRSTQQPRLQIAKQIHVVGCDA
jgi:hypothetical protein